MREILPGVLHWSVIHPKIKVEVSSYYLPDAGIVIDPLLPEGGPDAFEKGVEHVLLTNRHHYRDSGRLVEAFGCTVWCVESGLHEFTHGEKVKPFRFGDSLPGGIEAVEIGALCPDETALVLTEPAGVIALADGAVRMEPDGPLGFVPDEYMGDDPEAVKAGLKTACSRLLERDFDHLLLAHGNPWISGAKVAFREHLSTAGRH